MLSSLYRAARDHVKTQFSCAHGRTVHVQYLNFPQVHYAYLPLSLHWLQANNILGGGKTRVKQDEEYRAGSHRALFHAKVLNEAHTVDNISATTEKQLMRWVVMDISMGFTVTSGGANMQGTAQPLGFRCIYCIAHLLHFVVKDASELGFVQNPSLDNETCDFWHVLLKCQHLMSHF